MSENPFGGGFDLNAVLEQAQQMQAQLVQAQARLAAETVEGSAGGVTVVLTGSGEVTEVRISPEAVGGADVADADALAEALSDVGDLVVAAYRDGKGRVDALAQNALGPMADGLGGLGGALGGGPGV